MNDMNVIDEGTPIVLGAPELALAFAVARRIVKDEDAAADVAQEAMLLAHRFRTSFRGESHPHTWLYRIASTAALNWLRRNGREVARTVDTAAEIDPVDPSPSPEEQVATRQAVQRLMEQVDGLQSSYRDVLQLRALDQSEAEVADRLGLSVATVKIRSYRGRKLLRESLAA
jgi:RNA polymerase sigma-70 factor (ECF subfamily)